MSVVIVRSAGWSAGEMDHFWRELGLLVRVEAQYQQMYNRLTDKSRGRFLLRHAKYLLRPRLKPTTEALPTPEPGYELCARCRINRTKLRLCEPCRVQLFIGSQVITPHQYRLDGVL